MNETNDFISTLINNRERIVDKLSQKYSYEYLLKIFSEINSEKDTHIKILPSDKRLYRILSGTFKASRYNNSSIDWIPSEELVDGILKLANYFNIEHIEEIYTDMGILSALLSTKTKKITITTADAFQNIKTCNKLGLVPIAKRTMSDYLYYKQLNERYPQMIISSYYPQNILTNIEENQNNIFVEEISNLISSNNHDIILILLPHTFTNFNDFFYHLTLNSQYVFNTFHVKALDKYFYIHDLVKEYYKSPMIAHLLIKKNLMMNCDKPIESIFEPAIISSKLIDTYCSFVKLLHLFYEKLSPKLIKYTYRNYNFDKPFMSNTKLREMAEYYAILGNIINIPQYIYQTDEFLFWAKCVTKNLFFIFDDRLQFYDFYTQTISIKLSEIRRNLGNFPVWVSNLATIYMYIYMEIIKTPSNWKNSKKYFHKVFDEINAKNKKILYGK
jgi:hypothetical protein